MAAEGSLSDFLQANVDWHVAVSVASHNELLNGFMLALSRAIYDLHRQPGLHRRRGAQDDRGRRTRTHHRGDPRPATPTAAVRRMKRHVHAYAEAVLEVEDRTAIEVSDS